MQAQGRSARVPVICLGNLTVGGAGKTPAALAVARLLLAAHERPFFLSRGYGGRLAGPVLVNPSAHGAADVGDEPLMLARLASTIVARDRVAGAQAVRFGGASVIVMDDGFQNPRLTRTCDPPRRWPPRHRQRAHHSGRPVAGAARNPDRARPGARIVGPPDGAAAVADVARRHRLALFHGRLEPDRNSLAALGRRKILAFAGIAIGEIFATLTEAGITVAERLSFPDHHRYRSAEAQVLIARAEA